MRDRLIEQSERVGRSWVLQKQADYAAEDELHFQPEEEDDDDDDFDRHNKSHKKANKTTSKAHSFNILRDVVDPLRKTLSGALTMYFHGTVETGIDTVSSKLQAVCI